MPQYRSTSIIAILALMCLAISILVSQAEAGGKGGGKGKGGEDIILYNGNIVVRGEKKGGGNFVLANNHPTHEEVEFAPDFFGGRQGGYWR